MSEALAPAARRRLSLAETSTPVLARGVQLRYDEAPDEVAVAILQLCDGRGTVAAIVDMLASRYSAPRDEIASDVIAMLQNLANFGFVVQATGVSQ
jgi:pyrroloquinoline quinone biosynthesis protein D